MFVGVCGITYCALQAVITLYLGKLQISHVKLFVLRTVISSLLCVSGLVHVTMDVLLAFRLLERNHQRYKPWYSSWIDTMPSLTDFISDISEWLMFLLFAMFSATYFREFRDLGIEMSCFSKDSRREQGTSIKNYSPMLMQRESAGSDQDWTLHFIVRLPWHRYIQFLSFIFACLCISKLLLKRRIQYYREYSNVYRLEIK